MICCNLFLVICSSAVRRFGYKSSKKKTISSFEESSHVSLGYNVDSVNLESANSEHIFVQLIF